MNLIVWFIIGVLTLMVMGVISNSGHTSAENFQDQMYLMNCPLPIYDGVATLQSVDDFSLNYTVAYGSGASSGGVAQNFNGTYFECSVTNHLNGGNTIIKEYGATTLFGTIPYGYLGYIADWITAQFQHIQAFFTMVAFLLTPVNFDVFGYTISDLSGVALMVVIGVYILAYIGIAIFPLSIVIGMIGAFKP